MGKEATGRAVLQEGTTDGQHAQAKGKQKKTDGYKRQKQDEGPTRSRNYASPPQNQNKKRSPESETKKG